MLDLLGGRWPAQILQNERGAQGCAATTGRDHRRATVEYSSGLIEEVEVCEVREVSAVHRRREGSVVCEVAKEDSLNVGTIGQGR